MNATVTISNTFNLVYFYLHILFQDTKIHCKVGKSSWPQTLRHQKFHMHQHCTYTTAHTLSPSWRNAKPLLQFPSHSCMHWLPHFRNPFPSNCISLSLSPLLYGSTSTWLVMHKHPTLKDTVSHKHSHWIWRSHFKSILKAYQALISQHRLIR